MTTATRGQQIRDAIEAELAAARYYDGLASRTDDAHARQFLQDMAHVQHVHGSELNAQGRKAAGGELPDFARDHAEAIETLPEWREVDNVTFDEALEIALACKSKAIAQWASTAAANEGDVSALFRSLARSEADHADMIERVLVQRVDSQKSRYPLEQIARNIVDAERASARLYTKLANAVLDPRARKFLQGMAQVQELNASEIASRSQAELGGPILPKGSLSTAHVEHLPPGLHAEDLTLRAAMLLAADTEKRAALIYRSLARYVAGHHAELVRRFADDEDAQAARIAATAAQLDQQGSA